MQHLAAASPQKPEHRGVYINLDRSVGRRRNVERQLARLGLSDRYVRLPGVDGRTLSPRGNLNGGIIGCFRSHVEALAVAGEASVPVHVAEDDIVFSPHVAPFISFAAESGLFDTFDMVYLDLWVDPSLALVEAYLAAFARTGQLEPLDYRRLSVIDLQPIRIGATASYVVAPAGAAKVHRLLEEELARGPTMPVDHCYSRLTRDGAIKSAVIAPFLTSVDLDEGAISHTLTMSEHEHRLFLLLRSAFFVGRDLAGTVLPGLDVYRRTGRYPGLDTIRNAIAESAGLPGDQHRRA